MTLSESAYFPGETISAKVSLQSAFGPDAAEQASSPKSRSRSSMHSHSRKYSYSEPGSPIRERHHSFSMDHYKSSESSPSSPTSPTHPRGEHKKSRSVTFGSPKSNGAGFDGLPSLRLDTLSEHNQLLLNLHGQIVARFTINPNLVRLDKFDSVRGVGNITSGGIVSNTSNSASSRWSFSSLSSVVKSFSNPNPEATTTNANTFPIFFAVPTILDVQITLYPGEERTLQYKCKLPRDLPPTYAGAALRTSYHLKLSAQHTDHSITTIECPIHVHAQSTSKYDFSTPPAFAPEIDKQAGQQQQDLRQYSRRRGIQVPGAAFKADFQAFLESLDKEQQQDSPTIERPSALNIQDLVESNKGLQFDISRGPGEHVCTLTLLKRRNIAGKCITGVLNFTNAQLDCAQFTVSLEETELLDPEYCVHETQDALLSRRKIISQEQVTSAFLIRSSFAVPVPSATVGSFRCKPITLQYQLQFEFSISDKQKYCIEKHIKHGIEFVLGDITGSSFECRIPVIIDPDLRFGNPMQQGTL